MDWVLEWSHTDNTYRVGLVVKMLLANITARTLKVRREGYIPIFIGSEEEVQEQYITMIALVEREE